MYNIENLIAVKNIYEEKSHIYSLKSSNNSLSPKLFFQYSYVHSIIKIRFFSQIKQLIPFYKLKI